MHEAKTTCKEKLKIVREHKVFTQNISNTFDVTRGSKSRVSRRVESLVTTKPKLYKKKKQQHGSPVLLIVTQNFQND